MKAAIPGLLAAVLLGTTASAEPLRLDATAKYSFYGSDFIILFDDTGDGLLQLGEVTSFSGIFRAFDLLRTGIDRIPRIANISTAGGSCVFDGTNHWCFSDPAFQLPAGSFTVGKVRWDEPVTPRASSPAATSCRAW